MFMYFNQSLTVTWGTCNSDSFSATNGVKAGGIISPILFCIYIDDLLLELKKSGFGCYIGVNFIGALCYADDIVLLSPTVVGMKNMLLICEKYAKDHNILFNPVKSNAIIFSKPKALYHKKSDINFEINQNVIPLVSKVKHLGHVLYDNAGGDIDVNYIMETFNKSVNMLLADMGHVPSTILGKLFISYCNSLYGIVLSNVSNKMFDKMCIAWRKAVRKIYRIPWRSHNYLLHLIV